MRACVCVINSANPCADLGYLHTDLFALEGLAYIVDWYTQLGQTANGAISKHSSQ